MARLRLNNVPIADLMQVLTEAARYCLVVNVVLDSSGSELIIEPCAEEQIIPIKVTTDNIDKLM